MSMRYRGRINSFFGLLAGGLLSLFGRTPARTQIDDLKRADFTTSTQRLGVRFGEKIRSVFRFKWLRVSDRKSSDFPTRSEQNNKSSRIKNVEDIE